MKSFTALCVTAGICAIAGCDHPQESKQKNGSDGIDTIPVRIETVVPRDFVEYGEYFGTVAAFQEATLVCMLGGTVEKITAKEGDAVSSGSSLASIEAAKATSVYETAVLNEKIAQRTFEQTKKHLADSTVSQLVVDQAELGYLTARNNRIDAEKARSGALCITPIAGTVVSRFIDEHQELQPGRPTFTVAQFHKIKVRIGLPESDIEGVKEGNPAEVYFAALPGNVYEGKVFRMSRSADHVAKTFPVEVVIENPAREIKPGFTAKVRLRRGIQAGRIIVPTASIRIEGTDNFVMVEENDHAKRVPVILGKADERSTVITQGLSAGSVLIVEGQHLVKDGTPVAVIK